MPRNCLEKVFTLQQKDGETKQSPAILDEEPKLRIKEGQGV